VQHSWAERPDAPGAHQNLMDIEKQIRSVTKGAYKESPVRQGGAKLGSLCKRRGGPYPADAHLSK
jgi:hypothetical protein